MMNLFLIGLIGSLASVSAGSMSEYQIREILFWHNKARSDMAKAGRCANMLEIEWDTAVAAAADSNICPTSHNGLAAKAFGAGLGENLAWGSNTCMPGMCAEAGVCGKDGAPACVSNCNSYCTLKNRAFTGWYQEETENPLTSDDNCKSYNSGGGHCSQVVWQSSYKLGCAYQAGCPKWGTTLNCNYSPPGNVNVGATVKIGNCVTGNACSACPTTHKFCTTGENAGLCSRVDPGGVAPTNKPTESQPATNKPTTAATNKPTTAATNKPTTGATNKPTPGATNKPPTAGNPPTANDAPTPPPSKVVVPTNSLPPTYLEEVSASQTLQPVWFACFVLAALLF